MKTTIALVGPIASGKGAISELLIKKGYAHFTYGDEVRKEIDRRGLPIERSVYQDVSDDLRVSLGTEVLAQRIAVSIEEKRANGQAEKALIDGLRHPDEVKWLKEHFSTVVIGVTAPIDVRYERLRRRGRPSDPTTRIDFDRAERRDRGVGEPAFGNRVDDCLPLADIILENTGTEQELAKKLKDAFVRLRIEGNAKDKEGE
ncbi:MAG TPA: AAA family ATPase [Candidatus Saccharimonadales bacterium]|nr:AAA family ATPase [Candidatus Saccharimonadales bacterium]